MLRQPNLANQKKAMLDCQNASDNAACQWMSVAGILLPSRKIEGEADGCNWDSCWADATMISLLKSLQSHLNKSLKIKF
jgi:hypothetical protein